MCSLWIPGFKGSSEQLFKVRWCDDLFPPANNHIPLDIRFEKIEFGTVRSITIRVTSRCFTEAQGLNLEHAAGVSWCITACVWDFLRFSGFLQQSKNMYMGFVGELTTPRSDAAYVWMLTRNIWRLTEHFGFWLHTSPNKCSKTHLCNESISIFFTIQ